MATTKEGLSEISKKLNSSKLGAERYSTQLGMAQEVFKDALSFHQQAISEIKGDMDAARVSLFKEFINDHLSGQLGMVEHLLIILRDKHSSKKERGRGTRLNRQSFVSDSLSTAASLGQPAIHEVIGNIIHSYQDAAGDQTNLYLNIRSRSLKIGYFDFGFNNFFDERDPQSNLGNGRVNIRFETICRPNPRGRMPLFYFSLFKVDGVGNRSVDEQLIEKEVNNLSLPEQLVVVYVFLASALGIIERTGRGNGDVVEFKVGS